MSERRKRSLGLSRSSSSSGSFKKPRPDKHQHILDDSAYSTQLPDDDDADGGGDMEMGDEPARSNSSSGGSGSVSTSDALVTSTIRYPLKLPSSIFNVERRMRFTFHSRGTSSWMQLTGSTAMFYCTSNFFEIPHNHFSFYMPTAVATDIFSLSGTKFKVLDCNWSVEKLTARNFQEVNPAATAVYHQPVGAIQPAYEILCNANIQPTYRRRMWTDRISEGGTADNTSLKVSEVCEMAESKPKSLPNIIWQEPGTSNMKLLKTYPDFSRHTTIFEHNHKGYTHTPQFVKGWRRLVASTNPKATNIDKYDPAPFDDGEDWSLPITKYSGSETSNWSYLYHPVGADCKQRKFHYRMSDGYYPNMKSNENPDVFIRVRDEVDYNGDSIPIRVEIDIKSSMSISVEYGQSEFGIPDQADVRSNEPLLELISNEAYSIADIAGEIK